MKCKLAKQIILSWAKLIISTPFYFYWAHLTDAEKRRQLIDIFDALFH